jgi:TolB-like protein/Tfp pilus assembly protein PilF
LWARIRHHKVIEWMLAYVAAGFALLNGAELVSHAFEWSPLVDRLTIYILFLGAPVAAALAWYHGYRARQRVSGPELSILIALLVVGGSVLWLISQLSSERAAPAPAAVVHRAASPAIRPAASFDPPPHSIAVLPFVNLSGDPRQQYFSDGLTEELLNSLTRINELQVAARTSSFSFQGEHPDVATVAQKLNVASVLEGSVRRSGNTIRVTAQLNNAVTGFHLWSQTYDRDLGDILKLQTEIANAVTGALKVRLLEGEAAKIELGGTHNPAAFDAYLRASMTYAMQHGAEEIQAAIGEFTDAIRLDPRYALAFAGRSRAFSAYASTHAIGAAIRRNFDKARTDARQAIALAPELAEGQLALAVLSESGLLDFTQANEAYEHALALAPGNAEVLAAYGRFSVLMGRADASIAAARHAVTLDPLNPEIRWQLGYVLYNARRYREAVTTLQQVVQLDTASAQGRAFLGLSYYALGDFPNAQSSCEINSKHWVTSLCMAVTYYKRARYADAEAALAKMKAALGDGGAYQYAEIHAQWGSIPKALKWLDTAVRLRDPGLMGLKTAPLLDPLRKEPRFQAIERELKFPN